MQKNWLYRLLVLPLVLLVLSLVAIPVYAAKDSGGTTTRVTRAISDPGSGNITIESVKVYEGLWETGDMLFVVEYTVMYGTDPEEDPEDTFLVGVWDGAVKGPDRPLDYYYHNFTSIYLTNTQTDNFTYELYDELKVRVMGNPTYFPTLTEGVNMKTLTITAGHWIKGDDLEETRQYLADWCIILAEVFEDSWGTEETPFPLLTSGGRLNSTGMVKFKEAIPGLDSICPEIFQVATTYPEYEDPAYVKTYEGTLEGRAGAKLTAALSGLGKWITGKEDMGGLIGGVGLAILFFVLAGRIFIATGSVPTAVAVSIPFLFVGNIVGVLPLTITFVAAFIVVVLFGITFILGRL